MGKLLHGTAAKDKVTGRVEESHGEELQESWSYRS